MHLFCSDVWYDPSQTFIQPDGHFRFSAWRRLCRHISMCRVLVPQHTLFFAVIFLKNRSNPRSVPYIYRNQGMVLTIRCQVSKIKYF